MSLIIITGILSAGILPLFALIGFGVELLIDLIKTDPVGWGYWANCAIGFFVALIFGGINITIK